MPAQFTFGNAPRNVLRSPDVAVTDLSLVKNVPVGGPAKVQIRLEIFNAFNRVNYGLPNAVFGTANFGRVTATNTSYPNMRQMQLGARVVF